VAQASLISQNEQGEFALRSQPECAQVMPLEHCDAKIVPIVISTPESILKISVNMYIKSIFLVSLFQMMFKSNRMNIHVKEMQWSFYQNRKPSSKMVGCSFDRKGNINCVFLLLAGTVTTENASGMLFPLIIGCIYMYLIFYRSE
jgi:hypothetical protein